MKDQLEDSATDAQERKKKHGGSFLRILKEGAGTQVRSGVRSFVGQGGLRRAGFES
jgi:hypothetical protein